MTPGAMPEHQLISPTMSTEPGRPAYFVRSLLELMENGSAVPVCASTTPKRAKATSHCEPRKLVIVARTVFAAWVVRGLAMAGC